MRLAQLLEKMEMLDPAQPIYIEWAESEDSKPAILGFDAADSWRGSYEQLAIQPTDYSTVISTGDAFKMLKNMVGARVTGYKGGDYTISDYSPVWVDRYGESSCQQVIRVDADDPRGVILRTAFVDLW